MAYQPPFNFNTLVEARAYVDGLGVHLTDELTTGASQLSQTVPYADIVARAMRCNTPKELSVFSAELIQNCMRLAAPQAHQTLALSTKFLNASRTFLTSNNPDLLLLKNGYDAFLPQGSKIANVEQLNVYRRACAAYRGHIAEWADAFPVQTNEVQTIVRPGIHAGGVRFMIQCMIQKRNVALGAVGGGGGGEHVNILAGVFGEAGVPQLPFNPMKRRKGGQLIGGYRADGTFDPALTPLLITTAMMSQRVRFGESTIHTRAQVLIAELDLAADAYSVELRSALVIADLEYNHDYTAEGGGATDFTCQIANQDILFNAFFFLFSICGLTIENLFALQPTLFLISNKLRSTTTILRMLGEFRTRPAVGLVTRKLSRSTEVHLAPWVFTPRRLYDIVSVICPFNVRNPGATVRVPSISPRYVLNYRVLDQYFFGFLVSLHNLEARMYQLENKDIMTEISQAEHIFHQALLGRIHQFSNTQLIHGNALNVTVE